MQNNIQDTNTTLNLDVLERLQTNQPIVVYKKTPVGRVGVIVFNPISNKPEERILQGDPRDPKANVEKMIVKIFDEKSHIYFKQVNKNLLERGLIAVYNQELEGIDMTNAISDEEIDRILTDKFFTLKAALEKFTSPAPVERILRRAKELNKSHNTLEYITARIAELQSGQSLMETEKRLKDHYSNIEG